MFSLKRAGNVHRDVIDQLGILSATIRIQSTTTERKGEEQRKGHRIPIYKHKPFETQAPMAPPNTSATLAAARCAEVVAAACNKCFHVIRNS